MNLKNYTSTVAPESSLSRIEKRLVAIGANHISKEYENGEVKSVRFSVNVGIRLVNFELPVNVDKVYAVMWAEIKKPIAGTKERVRQQAGMTAWKIIADWVDIQCSMIYLEQADVLQVFMPYALTSGNQTVYAAFKDTQFKALGDGSN